VPLIVLTIGSRIEEILLLKRRNLVLRNGTYCLAIGLDPDQKGKTPDAERVVPIPQLLLDLGFVDWIRALPEDHGPLLFPDAAQRSEIDDLTGPFSKALNRILDACGLGDFDEDFYAMRKTLSSMLRRAGVDDGQRQAIAGHKRGTILNRHYTAHHSRDLKHAVDQADFRLVIADDARRGHPVIASCGLVHSESYAVDVVLDDRSEAETIRILHGRAGSPLFEFHRVDPMTGTRASAKVVQKAAQEFREFVAEHPLILPRHPLKRFAIEHFQALA
jgi:hypothetical protein